MWTVILACQVRRSGGVMPYRDGAVGGECLPEKALYGGAFGQGPAGASSGSVVRKQAGADFDAVFVE